MATSSEACYTASPQSTFGCGFAHLQGQAAPCLPAAPPPRKFHLLWGREGCLLYFSSRDHAKCGELGSRNSLPYSASEMCSQRLLLSTLSARLDLAEQATWRRWPSSIPLLSLPLVRAWAAWRPWARPGNVLTQVVKRGSRLGRSQQWLVGVPGNECGPASAPPAEPDMLNGSRRLAPSWLLPAYSPAPWHWGPLLGGGQGAVSSASPLPASTHLLTEPLSARLCSLPLCQGTPSLRVLRPQRPGVSAESTGFGV